MSKKCFILKNRNVHSINDHLSTCSSLYVIFRTDRIIWFLAHSDGTQSTESAMKQFALSCDRLVINTHERAVLHCVNCESQPAHSNDQMHKPAYSSMTNLRRLNFQLNFFCVWFVRPHQRMWMNRLGLTRLKLCRRTTWILLICYIKHVTVPLMITESARPPFMNLPFSFLVALI